MGTLNDFKLVNSKAVSSYELAKRVIDPENTISDLLSESEKARYGFYFLTIQSIINIIDYDDIADGIVDTELNSKFFQDKFDDLGVDAIYVDEEDHEISLFNFKYREKFNIDAKQSLNGSILSSKYLSVLKNGALDSLAGKLKIKTKDVLDCLDSNIEWSIVLYIVSNENNVVTTKDGVLNEFKNIYGLEIRAIGLDDISKLISDRPQNINATVVLPSTALMSYSENPLDSQVSYILRMNLVDLIRFTSDDEDLRKNASIEDGGVVNNVNLEAGILYDNIRGYLARSNYNKNIEKTLKYNPEKFFFYNNGITIVADSIRSSKINADLKYKLELGDFQVLNGGQTLRTIHNFNKKDKDNWKNCLSKAEVLVRVLNVTEDAEKNRIGEYTNSQNSITIIDLCSTRSEQLQLESFLKDNKILYLRKRGNTNITAGDYDISISISRLGQILLSAIGHPEEVSNKKKAIFDTYYDTIFKSEDLLSIKTVNLIHKYHNVVKEYNLSGVSKSEQKIMYVIYISEMKEDLQINDIINKIEEFVNEYLSDRNLTITPSRVFIRPDFRNWLDKKFEINTK